MAKHSTPKSGATSKFRMVVIDAELQDGEIGHLVQAIQGAFGGQRVVAAKGSFAAKGIPLSDAGDSTLEIDGSEVTEDLEPATIVSAPSKARAPKKIRTPNLDNSLHPGDAPSFKVYAEARGVTSATSVLTKFLTVAAWLHEERSGMKITADRAFTCFRFLNWPFNIDFDQPLRDMKTKSRFVELKPADKGKGEFTITHLGLDKVAKMKSA